MNKVLAIITFSFVSNNAQAQLTPNEVHAAVKEAGGAKVMLESIAKLTASKLPMMVDSNVQIIAVFAFELNITFTQRLVTLARKDIPDLEAWRVANANYAVCGSPLFSVLIRDYGVEVKYIVHSKDREYITEFNWNKTTCRGK